MSATSAPIRPRAPSAVAAVSRILVLAVLFALVTIAAVGIAGLVGGMVAVDHAAPETDAALARALAFAVIGAPLAGLVWWWQRRRLRSDPAERASYAWTLYVTAMSMVSLVGATWGLATAASAGLMGLWNPGALASGVVWTGVWLWHLRIRRSRVTAPARLVPAPAALGALFGVGLAALSAVMVLTSIYDEVWYRDLVPGAWWFEAAQGLVWTGLGALAWGWHWFGEHARRATDAFSDGVLLVTLGAASGVTMFAIGLDHNPVVDVNPLAATLVGGLVWAAYAGVVATRPPRTRSAWRLVRSAVALTGMASGVAVIVSIIVGRILAAPAPDDQWYVLFGAISAVLVGLPVWWAAWRPLHVPDADEAREPGRGLYLAVVAGAGAVAAIAAALLGGSQIFAFVLSGAAQPVLAERVGAPLGLLVAAGSVFAYHVAVRRRDRAIVRAAEPGTTPAIGRVVLVATPDAAETFAVYLGEQLGAPVVTLQAAEGAHSIDPAAMVAAGEELRGVAAPRVLVVAAGDAGARIVPLAD